MISNPGNDTNVTATQHGTGPVGVVHYVGDTVNW